MQFWKMVLFDMGKPGIEPGTSAYLTSQKFIFNHWNLPILDQQVPHRS